MVKETVQKMKSIADLFYAVLLNERHERKIEELLRIYEEENGKVEVIGSLLVKGEDTIIHFYLEPDFVLALNLNEPEFSELGYADIPLESLSRKHGLVARLEGA